MVAGWKARCATGTAADAEAVKLGSHIPYWRFPDAPSPEDDPPELTEAEQAAADDARQWAAENEHENREHAKNHPLP